mgnify:FL=1
MRQETTGKLLRGLKSRSFALAQQPGAHDPRDTGYIRDFLKGMRLTQARLAKRAKEGR